MVGNDSLQLIAYSCIDFEGMEFPIVTATPRRDWMHVKDDNAYRCLPLTMANQLGWFVLNPAGFVVEWTGDGVRSPVEITFDEPLSPRQRHYVEDHFGNGIVTWHIPYLFRTPPGYNLLVRGPANWIKDGIQALEGMIESDWIDATFTMNWKITRSHTPI